MSVPAQGVLALTDEADGPDLSAADDVRMRMNPPPAAMPQVRVLLADPIDLTGFRQLARTLLAARVPPQAVHWLDGGLQQEDKNGLFDGEMAAPELDLQAQLRIWRAYEASMGPSCATMAAPQTPAALTPEGESAARVPASFLDVCRRVILHRDPLRLSLLYRLLWRLTHEPGLRHDPLDADRMQAQRMARAVSREVHKMRAFVRFTAVKHQPLGPQGPTSLQHVAWFEPEHRIVEANAPFFMRRFAQMRWVILTPYRSVAWDGQVLQYGPGADPSAKPAPDAGEALWLTYYQHTFNPARLKVAMMKREMPVRYWPNLPEAALIAPLVQAAEARSQAMLEAAPTQPRRIRAPQIQHLRLAAGESPLSLAQLQAAAHACRACPLGAQATQAVCGEGVMAPTHMLVATQPEDVEDLGGRPFSGESGQLLLRALSELNWSRDTLYLSTALKHFKFSLQASSAKGALRQVRRQVRQALAPDVSELQACSHWLAHEVALVRPQYLVALGLPAARALLGRDVAEADMRQWWHAREDGLPVWVMQAPEALLALPATQRAKAWADWLDALSLARKGPSAPGRLEVETTSEGKTA